MAHPFAAKAAASNKRRLGFLGAKAGKAWGSSSMYETNRYPMENRGTSEGFTISGKTPKKRPDRYARGGKVGKKGTTVNISINPQQQNPPGLGPMAALPPPPPPIGGPGGPPPGGLPGGPSPGGAPGGGPPPALLAALAGAGAGGGPGRQMPPIPPGGFGPGRVMAKRGGHIKHEQESEEEWPEKRKHGGKVGKGESYPGYPGSPTGPDVGGKSALAMKKGGKVHGDEAEDRKLFKKMYKAEEKKEEAEGKKKRGGHVRMKSGGRLEGGESLVPSPITGDAGAGSGPGRAKKIAHFKHGKGELGER